jgi:hypothetical protein
MKTTNHFATLGLSCVLGVLSGLPVQGQGVQRASYESPAGGRQTLPSPWNSGGVVRASATNPALEYFAGNRARSATQSAPAATPQQTVIQLNVLEAKPKPFENVFHEPTVSPYLNLNPMDSLDGAQLYYLNVRPQIEQRRLSQIEQAEQRKQQQRERVGGGNKGVVSSGNVNQPTTSASPQFNNTGSYYSKSR